MLRRKRSSVVWILHERRPPPPPPTHAHTPYTRILSHTHTYTHAQCIEWIKKQTNKQKTKQKTHSTSFVSLIAELPEDWRIYLYISLPPPPPHTHTHTHTTHTHTHTHTHTRRSGGTRISVTRTVEMYCLLSFRTFTFTWSIRLYASPQMRSLTASHCT